jgi:hypothetical protein
MLVDEWIGVDWQSDSRENAQKHLKQVKASSFCAVVRRRYQPTFQAGQVLVQKSDDAIPPSRAYFSE